MKQDSQKIKRFKSAYLFYCEENRGRLKNEYPNWTTIEIIKRLAEEWKALDNKDAYYAKEAIEHDTFNQLKETNEYTYIKRPKIKKPKRFRTAFMLYLKDKKDYVKNNGEYVENLKEIGKQWKQLSNKERDKYNTMCNEDKVRYKGEYLEYIDQLIKQKETKKEQRIKMKKLFEESAKIFKTESNIFYSFAKGKEMKDDESYNNLVMTIKEVFRDKKDIEQLKKRYLEICKVKDCTGEISSIEGNEDHQYNNNVYDSHNDNDNDNDNDDII